MPTSGDHTPHRVFNFSAGPSMLPLPVLEQVREELTDWLGSGMSVMEVSHRSKEFGSVANELQSLLRELLELPAGYRVVLMQGGARAQCAAVPLNLTAQGSTVDYLNTGVWSAKAIAEARRFCTVNVAADEAASGYTTVPAAGSFAVTRGAAYLHYTPNETIGGVEFPYVPETGDVPLVADMSSSFLSRPIEVSRFGLIYAGAQKNIGPAGLCVVIVREELLGRARHAMPSVLDYKALVDSESMLNTPPTFVWYVAALVLRWLRDQGGLKAMGERNRGKAAMLYQAIDALDFYRNPVAPECRSWMNVPFTLADSTLDARFLSEARAAGLTSLKGHFSVGGIRASIYNAMPREGVAALIAFMREFERRHG